MEEQAMSEVAPEVVEAPAPPPAEQQDSVPAAAAPTSAASHSQFVIPDFAEDSRAVTSFESARERFERSESQAAEDEIRVDFRKRRDLIQAEIATSEAVIGERQSKWEKSLQAYGKRYPTLIEKNKPRRPSLMQNFFSFGKAAKMYQATVDATADLNDARSLRRRKEHEEEELDGLQRRALSKLEETLRTQAKGQTVQEKFLARPGNQALAKRVAEIRAERAAYAARLEAGKVPPLEHRDRHFAELAAVPLVAPFSGVAIVGVETYGDMCYLIFRDRERHHFHHAYDPRLEGLSDSVFDVYRIADRFEAKLHRREGKPMNLADHLTEYLRDDERAKTDARRIRALLREPRPAKPYEGDRTVVDLLAELAKSASRFAAPG